MKHFLLALLLVPGMVKASESDDQLSSGHTTATPSRAGSPTQSMLARVEATNSITSSGYGSASSQSATSSRHQSTIPHSSIHKEDRKRYEYPVFCMHIHKTTGNLFNPTTDSADQLTRRKFNPATDKIADAHEETLDLLLHPWERAKLAGKFNSPEEFRAGLIGTCEADPTKDTAAQAIFRTVASTTAHVITSPQAQAVASALHTTVTTGRNYASTQLSVGMRQLGLALQRPALSTSTETANVTTPEADEVE